MNNNDQFPIVQQFILENDDHFQVRISSCTKDFILSLVPKGRNQQQTNDLYEYFSDSFSYFEDKKGLYFRRHLSLKFYKPLCLIIFYQDSSLVWWNSLRSMKKEEEEGIMNQKHNIPDLFAIASEPSAFIHTIMEIPANWVFYYINYAIKIEGWEKENPPFEIISIGNEEVQSPRFVTYINNDDYGDDCVLKVSTYEGNIIDCDVIEGGNGYFIDDNLEILSPKGKKGKAIVRRVKNGKVVEAHILQGGSNYENGEITNTLTNKNTPFYPFHRSDSMDGLEENSKISYIVLPE
jgi:hypothetical protein